MRWTKHNRTENLRMADPSHPDYCGHKEDVVADGAVVMLTCCGYKSERPHPFEHIANYNGFALKWETDPVVWGPEQDAYHALVERIKAKARLEALAVPRHVMERMEKEGIV